MLSIKKELQSPQTKATDINPDENKKRSFDQIKNELTTELNKLLASLQTFNNAVSIKPDPDATTSNLDEVQKRIEEVRKEMNSIREMKKLTKSFQSTYKRSVLIKQDPDATTSNPDEPEVKSEDSIEWEDNIEEEVKFEEEEEEDEIDMELVDSLVR